MSNESRERIYGTGGYDAERFDVDDFNEDVDIMARDILERWVTCDTPCVDLSHMIVKAQKIASEWYNTLISKGRKTYMRKRYGKDDSLFTDVPWPWKGDLLGDTPEELKDEVKKIIEEDQNE